MGRSVPGVFAQREGADAQYETEALGYRKASLGISTRLRNRYHRMNLAAPMPVHWEVLRRSHWHPRSSTLLKVFEVPVLTVSVWKWNMTSLHAGNPASAATRPRHASELGSGGLMVYRLQETCALSAIGRGWPRRGGSPPVGNR